GFPAVRIAASAVATDRLTSEQRWRDLQLSAVRESCRKAYGQADVKPAEIDFYELHDAYTIITALSLEAAGFAERGEGAYFGLGGEITLEGRLPISTMGGLKARGHPVGAT